MAKNLLFAFDNLAASAKKASAIFARAGANIVQQDVGTSIKRTSGVSYRELTLTFADSQTVVLRVKKSGENTGDIWQVLVNGKVTPIKNQDDHEAAVAQIAALLDAGRTRFQAKLAAAKVKIPAGIRTAAPKLEVVLTQKRDDLKVAIAAVREEIAGLAA